MKTRFYLVIIVFAILSCFNNSKAQSNKSLSNLTSPTAVNQSLLPNTNNSKDLGSSTLGWRDIYISNRLYLQGSLTLHSPGTGNFFAGGDAGNTFLTGTYNTGTGQFSLNSLTTGYSNTATGSFALNSNTTGFYNTANGTSALSNNTTGHHNTVTGASAMNDNTTGFYNTANGYYALFSNTSGYYNTATGSFALNSNTTGKYNIANGHQSLYSNTTGSYNTVSGSDALHYNITGSNNTANGYQALLYNKTGNANTALGNTALYYNTTGYSNVAVGTGALFKNTSGANLVAIGDSALYNFTASSSDYSAGANTAVGSKTLYQNTTGTTNTAFGSDALYGNISGSYNTATGRGALAGNHTGSYNTAVGYNAIVSNAAGNYNTAIGAYAGSTMWFSDVVNSVSIGYYADAYQSNQVRIGNTSVTSIGGQVGWTTFSDGRYKRNLKENVAGLAFINSLRPVTYNVDTKSLDEYFNKRRKQTDEEIDEKTKAELDKSTGEASLIVHDGFIAQEVEAAAKKLGFAFSGVDKPKTEDGLYGLRYDNFVVPLVKAVQELSKQNDSLIFKMREFENVIIENQYLKSRLELIEQKLGITSQQNISSVALTIAGLQQNTPNPFSNSTIIHYTLPQKFISAQIIITDAAGKILKQSNISGAGKGILNVDASTLSSGAYNYSLIVDGKIIDTKKMLLSK